jgi:hypothetical protein
MKKLLFLSLLLLASVAYAQKVTYKNNTISQDGQPYCLIKKKGSNIFGIESYTVFNLTDQELIVVKPIAHTTFWEAIFRESGTKVYLPHHSVGAEKRLGQFMIERKLLDSDGKINPEAQRFIIQEYGTMPILLQQQLNAQTQVVSNPPSLGDGTQYLPVQRDRSQPLYFMYELIRQGVVDIAQYKTNIEAIASGLQVSHIFTLPNGLKVAQATYLQSQNNPIQIITLRDSQVHTLGYPSGKTDMQIAEVVARYLIERNYL